MLIENGVEAKAFNSKTSISILNALRKEKMNNVCHFQGNFEIAPNLSLEVAIYAKTSEKKFPTFSKYSKLSGFKDIQSQDQIYSKAVYINPQSTEYTEIPSERIVKGYQYG